MLFFLLCLCAPTQADLNLTHTTSFVVFPQDCNANPPMLFGGKILSEMDRCAGITTRRLLYASTVKDAVTVSVTDVVFRKPGQVKDLIFVTGTVTALGEKSVTILVKVERELDGGKRELLADGKFVFVAYDLVKKKAVPHGLTLKVAKADQLAAWRKKYPPTDIERRHPVVTFICEALAVAEGYDGVVEALVRSFRGSP